MWGGLQTFETHRTLLAIWKNTYVVQTKSNSLKSITNGKKHKINLLQCRQIGSPLQLL